MTVQQIITQVETRYSINVHEAIDEVWDAIELLGLEQDGVDLDGELSAGTAELILFVVADHR